MYDEIDQTWFHRVEEGWRGGRQQQRRKKPTNFLPRKILASTFKTISSTFLAQYLDKLTAAIASKQKKEKYTYIYKSEFLSTIMQRQGLAGHRRCVLENFTAKNTVRV